MLETIHGKMTANWMDEITRYLKSSSTLLRQMFGFVLSIWAVGAAAKTQSYVCDETLAVRLNQSSQIETRPLQTVSLRVSVGETLPEGARYQKRPFENHAILDDGESKSVFWLSDFSLWAEYDTPYFVGYGMLGESIRLNSMTLIHMRNDVKSQYIVRATCRKDDESES